MVERVIDFVGDHVGFGVFRHFWVDFRYSSNVVRWEVGLTVVFDVGNSKLSKKISTIAALRSVHSSSIFNYFLLNQRNEYCQLFSGQSAYWLLSIIFGSVDQLIVSGSLAPPTV